MYESGRRKGRWRSIIDRAVPELTEVDTDFTVRFAGMRLDLGVMDQ